MSNKHDEMENQSTFFGVSKSGAESLFGLFIINVFVGLYNHCIQKRPEKKDFIEQDVLPSRAEEAREGETSCSIKSFFSGLFWMQCLFIM